jgi:hypothetical protein
MDRCDAANWRSARNNNVSHSYGDPRYWNGRVYATVIDRMVEEAKYRLVVATENDWLRHRLEMQARISLGDSRSQFWPTGQRK